MDAPPAQPLDRRPRRVAVFTGHFLPHVGGVEIYSHRLWSRMAARGWDVLLVTSDVGGGPVEEVVDGIRVRRIPCLPLMGGRFPIPVPGAGWRGALRAVRDFRPDVVVTNLRFMPPCWIGAAWARRRRVPRLHVEHGSGHVPLRSAVGDRLSRLLDLTVGRLVIRGAERTVGVSSGSAAFATTLGAGHPGILPMGVAPPRADEAGRWRERLGLAGGDRVVLFLGRLTADKGVRVLLEAWSRMAPAPGERLVLAGDGPLRAEVEARAAALAGVRVLGPVPPAEVPLLLSVSHVLAHPSLASEGRPLAVLEAAAAGLAVVSTPQGVADDLVTGPGEGALVPAGDPDAMARALRLFLDDEGARASVAATLQRKVLDRFGWDRVLETADAELAAARAARR